MRAVFQTQPEVGHVYLGSKRHVLERIFNDKNEPFWRSAKQMELGPIAPAKFAPFIRKRFDATEKAITPRGARAPARHHRRASVRDAGARLLRCGSSCRPGTTRSRTTSTPRSSRCCAPSTTTSRGSGTRRRAAQRLLMLALAEEPAHAVYSAGYRERHDLPRRRSTSEIALAGAREEGDRRPRRATATAASSSRSSPSGSGASSGRSRRRRRRARARPARSRPRGRAPRSAGRTACRRRRRSRASAWSM